MIWLINDEVEHMPENAKSNVDLRDPRFVANTDGSFIPCKTSRIFFYFIHKVDKTAIAHKRIVGEMLEERQVSQKFRSGVAPDMVSQISPWASPPFYYRGLVVPAFLNIVALGAPSTLLLSPSGPFALLAHCIWHMPNA